MDGGSRPRRGACHGRATIRKPDVHRAVVAVRMVAAGRGRVAGVGRRGVREGLRARRVMAQWSVRVNRREFLHGAAGLVSAATFDRGLARQLPPPPPIKTVRTSVLEIGYHD